MTYAWRDPAWCWVDLVQGLLDGGAEILQSYLGSSRARMALSDLKMRPLESNSTIAEPVVPKAARMTWHPIQSVLKPPVPTLRSVCDRCPPMSW